MDYMRIGIFGSSGFIGKSLAVYLAKTYQVMCFTRQDLSLSTILLAEKIKNLDVIINLVGAPILSKRWSDSYKNVLVDSRIDTVNKIKDALSISSQNKQLFMRVFSFHRWRLRNKD